VDKDGPYVGGVNVSIIKVNIPADARMFSDGAVPQFHDGRFSVAGLPLDGTYRLMVSDSEIDRDTWIISEEFTLSRAQPTQELTLTFPDGITVEAVVLGPNGDPVPGAEVLMGFDTQWSHGAGGVEHQTDRNGRVVWHYVNPDLPAYYHVTVLPGADTQGTRRPVDLAKSPITIRLQRGAPAAGVLIDDATGRPIPGIEVELWPQYGKHAPSYGREISVTTDSRGLFRLDNLEAGAEYRVQSSDVVPSGVQITTRPDGSVSYRYGINDLTVTGGKLDHVLRVKARPGKVIRPLPPEDSPKTAAVSAAD